MSEVLDIDETMYQDGGRSCRRKGAAADVGVEEVLRLEHACGASNRKSDKVSYLDK